jgi:hypothetical protein
MNVRDTNRPARSRAATARRHVHNRRLSCEALEQRLLLSTYYVATTGHDAGAGSPADPWQTIRHVYDEIGSAVRPGDTVYFHGGTYRLYEKAGQSDEWFHFDKGGTPGNPITFRACAGETVVWDALYNLSWTQDSTYQWHVSLAGTPPLTLTDVPGDEADPWHTFAHVKNGFEPVRIFKAATCVAGAVAPSGLVGAQGATTPIGRFTQSGVFNNKPYYAIRSNSTMSPDYFLVWDGEYWRITNTHPVFSPMSENYWYLNVAHADTPESATPYTGHGTCVGQPIINYLDSGALPADFVNPPEQTTGAPGQIDFYHTQNDTDRLVFDLLYYDIVDQVLYFRSNEINPISDPNTQVYVGGGYNQVRLDTPYDSITGSRIGLPPTDLTFDGITFGWGTNLALNSSAPPASRIVVRDCRFQGGCLIGHADDSRFERLYIDYVGGHVWRFDGSNSYQIDWHYHDVYLLGSDIVMQDSFLGRSHSGYAAHFSPGASNNLQFSDNVCYGPQVMVYNGGADGQISDNVMIAAPSWYQGVASYSLFPAGWRLTQGSSGQTFYNNYVEVVDGASIDAGDYGTVESDVSIHDNVLVQTDANASKFLAAYSPSVTFQAIQDNAWVGNGNHGAYLQGALNTSVPAVFMEYLQSRGWDGNAYVDSNQRLSTWAVDAWLNTNPSLDDVLAYFRQYAVGRDFSTAENTPPTDIVLSKSAVAEAQGLGIVVGGFSTVDPGDVNSPFIYSLVSGEGDVDNGSFAVTGGQLVTAVQLDYEAKNSYSVRVRSTDPGGMYTEKAFTIAVTDVDEIPTAAVDTPSSPTSGTVAITYLLSDPESDVCSIVVEYSLDAGTSWHTATPGSGGDEPTGLSSSLAGTSHTFVWASGADIVDADIAGVLVRITPTDAAQGTAGTSGGFAIHNYVPKPEITVLLGTTVIISGQTTPIDLGTGAWRQWSCGKTFTIRNDGDATLMLVFAADSGAGAPIHVGQPGTVSVPPGETTTFYVCTDIDNYIGTTSGLVSFECDDADGGDGVESPFTFAVTATILPAQHDWTTPGMYNRAVSRFYLRNDNSGGNANLAFAYGPASAGWIPLAGDWDGNGTETIGLYDPVLSRFYIRNDNSAGYATKTFAYGQAGAGWTPLVGDWNGDGIDTVGLYDPAISRFYLRNSNTPGFANVTFAYGPAGGGWMPLAGDWNGDGIDTPGVYDPALSRFYLRNSNTPGFAEVTFRLASADSGWKPVAGDWDNDQHDTVGLYAPDTSCFYLKNSNVAGAADATFAYGPAGSGWTPLVGDWNGLPSGTTSTAGSTAGATMRQATLHGSWAVDPRVVDRIDLLAVAEYTLGHSLDDADSDSDLDGINGIGPDQWPVRRAVWMGRRV